jgi:uncharacterized protein YkvS
MDQNQEQIISNKNGLIFSKINKNHYKLIFSLENQHIDLSKIIDFGLVRLIYDLNKDLHETFSLDKLNDNEAIITILLKHFFEDLGLPQRFSYAHIQKYIENDNICFKSQSIKSQRPEGIPSNAELMSIKEFLCIFHVINPHKINNSCIIRFDDIMNIPPFVEKVISLILNKMFNRVKLFIENLRI